VAIDIIFGAIIIKTIQKSQKVTAYPKFSFLQLKF